MINKGGVYAPPLLITVIALGIEPLFGALPSFHFLY